MFLVFVDKHFSYIKNVCQFFVNVYMKKPPNHWGLFSSGRFLGYEHELVPFDFACPGGEPLNATLGCIKARVPPDEASPVPEENDYFNHRVLLV